MRDLAGVLVGVGLFDSGDFDDGDLARERGDILGIHRVDLDGGANIWLFVYDVAFHSVCRDKSADSGGAAEGAIQAESDRFGTRED